MLEAEWRQFLRGSVSTGAKEDESSTGRVWAVGISPCYGLFSLGGRFKTYEPFVSLIFQFCSGRGEPRILNQQTQGHDCTLYLEHSWR
jgi:hypothetical protein